MNPFDRVDGNDADNCRARFGGFVDHGFDGFDINERSDSIMDSDQIDSRVQGRNRILDRPLSRIAAHHQPNGLG